MVRTRRCYRHFDDIWVDVVAIRDQLCPGIWMRKKRRDWTRLPVMNRVHRVEQVSGIQGAFAKQRGQLVTPNGGVPNRDRDTVFPAPFDDWAGFGILCGDGNPLDIAPGMLDVS